MSGMLVDRYMIALRICQPARIQDILKTVLEIWPDMPVEETRSKLFEIHELMRATGAVHPVRRGTYILSERGLSASARVRKERILDNARIFLMKDQRKRYHKVARRLG